MARIIRVALICQGESALGASRSIDSPRGEIPSVPPTSGSEADDPKGKRGSATRAARRSGEGGSRILRSSGSRNNVCSVG